MKIIVGAGSVRRAGWLSLQQSDLDITDARAWSRLFGPNSLDAILTEHTLEHLTEREARAAVENFYAFLKVGGYVRCAVPDGLHTNARYLNWVAPDSPGERWLNQFRAPGERPHVTLWNYRSLSMLFNGAGFRVQLQQWFDERGTLNVRPLNLDEGYIRRRFGAFYSDMLSLLSNSRYVSLIIDAVKIARPSYSWSSGGYASAGASYTMPAAVESNQRVIVGGDGRMTPEGESRSF
jgi:predicted SAM-dependent methyltransferase